MTRERLLKHWDVIQAFKNGELIEWKFQGKDDTCWQYTSNPAFLIDCEYRIKEEPPKPEYIHFDFSDAEFLIGKAVINKDIKSITLILGVNNESIAIGYSWKTYQDLFDNFTFLDGSICGKLKEER